MKKLQGVILAKPQSSRGQHWIDWAQAQAKAESARRQGVSFWRTKRK